MGKRGEYNYFEVFEKMVGYAGEAAQALKEAFDQFDPAHVHKNIDLLHKIEHRADDEKHEMMKRLAREFITPIEREDIMMLAQEIDEVIDNTEDVLLRIYMFHIQKLRPEAPAFAKIILDCCTTLQKTMRQLPRFRKSDEIAESIVEINHLEEEGDRLYTESMRSLYGTCKDPLEIMTWTETFNRMEKCCDACEHVADVVEGIILKNS